MYKAKDLEDLTQAIRIASSSAITLDGIRQVFVGIAEENSTPYTFKSEEVKYGGLLNSAIAPALLITHPDHPHDYYGILVALKDAPGITIAHIYSVGKSKQMKKFALSEMGKKQRKGQSLSYKIGNLAVQGLMTIGKSKDKLAAEQAWYDAVMAILDSVFE